jgi:hypothetical protein
MTHSEAALLEEGDLITHTNGGTYCVILTRLNIKEDKIWHLGVSYVSSKGIRFARPFMNMQGFTKAEPVWYD